MTDAAPANLSADKVVPILGVDDISRTVEFYVDGLGFTKKNEWIKNGRLRWCYLEYPGGAAVMAQEGQPDDSTSRKGVGIKLYFWCNDAIAFHKDVTERGIEVHEPFVGNGMHVVDLQDPDGYDLAFQSPAGNAEIN